MATTRSASTQWTGNLADGSGQTSFNSSNQPSQPVTWKARSESANGKTSPEELIAAAHSACLSMAFAHALGQQGYTPETIDVSSDITLEPGVGITGDLLKLNATVPGIDNETFQKIAQAAKENCPISTALAGIDITMDATLNN